MISFEAFRQTDGTPIYLQIIRYIQQGLAAGTIQDGDELPSRRVVSALTSHMPQCCTLPSFIRSAMVCATSSAGTFGSARCW